LRFIGMASDHHITIRKVKGEHAKWCGPAVCSRRSGKTIK
jgi:hypothetical protein